MSQAIADSFEASFLSSPLSEQIRACDSYELAPLFEARFRDAQPVLEAGCGSGRWCGWLRSRGIASDGVDWSRRLCERAAAELPASRFFACDMGDTGLPDGAYGGILALGSMEHAMDGPRRVLDEFYRLLRPGGVAIVTVPYGSALRHAVQALTYPAERARGVPLLRRWTGKRPLAPGARSYAEARYGTQAAWHPRFALGPAGWSFYEYGFDRRQMADFVQSAGFRIEAQFAAFPDEGVLHTFGPLAGRWNHIKNRVDLRPAGQLLRRLLPTSLTGHMLCFVLRRPDGAESSTNVALNRAGPAPH